MLPTDGTGVIGLAWAAVLAYVAGCLVPPPAATGALELGGGGTHAVPAVTAATTLLLGELPALARVLLAVPLVHAFAHKCAARFGGYAVSGAGLVGEFAEQHFSAGGPTARAGQAANMSTGNSRTFHDANAREYSIKLTDELPASLLARALDRRLALTEAVAAFDTALAAVDTGIDTSEAALQEAHRKRASDALRPLPQPPWSSQNVPSAGKGGSATTLPFTVLKRQADALRAAIAVALAAAPEDMEAVYQREVGQSADATAAMARRRVTQRDGGSRLSRALAVSADLDVEVVARSGSGSTPDGYIRTLFNVLHAKARALASARVALQRVTRNDLRRQGLQATFNRTLSEVGQLLQLLRDWKAQSSVPAVRRWSVPGRAADIDPAALPSALGTMVFDTGSTAWDLLLDAHLRVQRLHEDAAMWVEEAHAAERNAATAVARLSADLVRATAAAAAAVDVEGAAGSSGVVVRDGTTAPASGLPVLFSITMAQADAAGVHTQHIAAGLAAELLRGVRRFSLLHAQLVRLCAGLTACRRCRRSVQ